MVSGPSKLGALGACDAWKDRRKTYSFDVVVI